MMEMTKAEIAHFARAEMETKFWAILDDREFAAVPSDMWDALELIVRGWRARKQADERSAALLEGMKQIEDVLRQGRNPVVSAHKIAKDAIALYGDF